MQKTIVDIDFRDTTLTVVEKENGKFDVVVGNEVKHPDCDEKSVMRALGHYLHSLNYQLAKIQNKE